MKSIRYNHTAILLPSGKVLIVGGNNATSGPLGSAELYDLATGMSQGTGSLTQAIEGPHRPGQEMSCVRCHADVGHY